jgi:hypothetical protein
LGADILVVFIIFSIKSVEIMKIMVVFYRLQICPWISGERKKFPILVFLGNFFQIFQEKFEIQDGHQRSHDMTTPLKTISKVFFFT